MLDLIGRSAGPQELRYPPAGVPGTPPTDLPRPGRPGRPRVFTGEWFRDGCACHTYTDGYAGHLVRYWNGWCVFRTSRAVADIIVAEHQATFTELMAEHTGRGAPASDAWLAALGQSAFITWLGPQVVIDSRVYTGDDTQVEITTPDADNLYTIGWGWRWDATDVAAVHTVHGAINP